MGRKRLYFPLHGSVLVSPIPIMFSMTWGSVKGCDHHGRNKYCHKNSTIYKPYFLSSYFSAVRICLGEKAPMPNFDYGRKLWKAARKRGCLFYN